MTQTTEKAPIRRAYLTGSTYMVRERLKGDGWTWDASRKAWTWDSDWKDEAEVIRAVRAIGGIRNRGSFSATLEEI